MVDVTYFEISLCPLVGEEHRVLIHELLAIHIVVSRLHRNETAIVVKRTNLDIDSNINRVNGNNAVDDFESIVVEQISVCRTVRL